MEGEYVSVNVGLGLVTVNKKVKRWKAFYCQKCDKYYTDAMLMHLNDIDDHTAKKTRLEGTIGRGGARNYVDRSLQRSISMCPRCGAILPPFDKSERVSCSNCLLLVSKNEENTEEISDETKTGDELFTVPLEPPSVSTLPSRRKETEKAHHHQVRPAIKFLFAQIVRTCPSCKSRL